MQGKAHMLFHHVAGNIQSFRDFVERKILERSHDEYLAAARRQCLGGGAQAGQSLLMRNPLVGWHLAGRSVFWRIAEFEMGGLRLAAAGKIADEIDRDLLQQCGRIG